MRVPSKSRDEPVVAKKRHDRIPERVSVARWNKQSVDVVLDELRHAGDARGDDGSSRCERLDDDHAKRLRPHGWRDQGQTTPLRLTDVIVLPARKHADVGWY